MFQLSNTDGKHSGSAMNWSLGTLYPLEGHIGHEILEVGLLSHRIGGGMRQQQHRPEW